MEHPLILIGTENSYFTAKVKGYLRWRGLPFVDVTPTAEVAQKYIRDVVKATQIPVLVDRNCGKNVCDSSNIIDHCEAMYRNGAPSVHGEGPIQGFLSYFLECFADEWMKLPALHARWGANVEQLPHVAADWGRSSLPNMKPSQAQALTKPQRDMFKASLPAFGITADTAPHIDIVYKELLEALNVHLERHEFLFGSCASLADFCFAGPFYSHLMRDPIPAVFLKTNYPMVSQWVERSMGITPGRFGKDWAVRDGVLCQVPCEAQIASDRVFEGDAVPETLRRVVSIAFREHAPMLRASSEAVAQHIASNADVKSARRPLKRSLGPSPFVVAGHQGTRTLLVFEVWKLQRARTFLQSCSTAEQAAVAAFCAGIAHGGDIVEVVMGVPKTRLHEARLYADGDEAKL